MKKSRRNRISPIKVAPPRQAGQSLQERRDDLFDAFTETAIYPFLAIGFCGWEWYRYLTYFPPSPGAITFVTVLVLIWAIPRLVRQWKELQQMKLGLLGEKHVGAALEALRAKGFHVIHDVPGDGWNIDHVLVGTRGVYAIETKTASKPDPKATVDYDGTAVRVAGLTPDRNPIVQAEAAAAWLRDFVLERSTKKIPVRPVVLYPGWFISKQPKGVRVWVLNEKALPDFLMNEPETLRPEDAAHIHACLLDYARPKQKTGR